ncbi:MAG: YncE family protein [Planctomycetota bacterium]|nr:MAG: YncE family protein [Planctomycetota bacterium]
MVDKRLSKKFWSVLVIGGISMFSADGTAIAHSDYLGPVDVVNTFDHKYLFIACLDGMEVVKFDLSSNAVVERIQLSEKPTGLQLCPLNRNLFVTCGGPLGRVAVINTQTSEIITTIQVGHTPVCSVVSPDGKKLYVCNRFDNAISVINLETLKCSKQIAVNREPIATDITPDGKYLVVANHLPAGPADKDFIAAEVSIVDTDQYQVHSIRLPNGATGLRDVFIAPDGTYAYVTLILARYQLPTTQLERGWMNTNALAVIDIRKREFLNTVLLDTITSGAANPWAVSGTADGRYLCVTHAGTHEVSVIDQPGMLKKLYAAAKKGLDEHTDGGDGSIPERAFHYGNVPNDLRFLVGLRRRLKLAGNGPRSLTVVGTKVYAVEYFSDSLGVIDIHPDKHARARSIHLGGKKALNEIRKGQMLFHDATLCFQQWQSCVSCHPDGRADTHRTAARC